MSDLFSSNKRIATNSLFLSIRMVIVLGITLYTTRTVLSLLGVEDYGVFNIVCGFVSMFTFLNTSMSNGIQRYYNYELGKNGEEGAKRVYNSSLRIQIHLAILIIVFAETVGLWYLNNKIVIPEDRMIAAGWIFQLSVLSFLFIIIQAPFMAAVMAHERMVFFAFISIYDAVLKLAIVFLVPILGGDKLIIYGFLLALISVSDFVIYFLYCKRKFREIKFNRFHHKDLFKSMLGFSGWNIFGALSGVMKDQGINLVMNYFFGPVVNAAQGVALQVSVGFQSLVQNITIPVRPQIIQSYSQGDINRVMNLTFTISKLSSLFLYMIALPVLMEINYLLKIWLGENIPEHTSMFILIIVLTCFISNLNQAISAVVHASGNMRLYQILGGTAGILTVPAAYLILKLGGSPESALWMALGAMAVAQFNALWILKSIVEYSIKDYLKQVMFPFILVVISTIWIPLLPIHFMEEGFWRFCVVLVISVSMVALSIYYLGLGAREKEFVFRMIKQ